ncbi:DUF2894 domain-containing protein [Variovorax sp. KBS0712]|uniref:DUF2894 domain-containing protein n=1 Tax=Variovorax sp. KBS0712 TaxID=2578111 RepID=UPI00111A1E23|nr:DUF2894 domain-containing protein [Variovorax sp. KBS0712]TSD58861.1 DUF2894 domain-containing protein [Variovorax sp. KBS0712]
MSNDTAPDDQVDAIAALDAWRARGDDRFDPVRFRFIEAMALRAAAHEGEARRLLDARLASLMATYRADLEKVEPEAEAPAEAPLHTALAELMNHIAQLAPLPPPPDAEATDGDTVPSLSTAPELKTLSYFRGTWSKLAADQRVTQSLAKVPKNAGPLNTHHLVQRALTLMRDLSPQYLQRFMAHVDALLWIEQVNAAAEAARVARTESPRKSSRSRAS